MIHYKDMTFCTYHALCKDGPGCFRALTDRVLKDARKWWGGDNVPICRFGEKPKCFNEVFKDEKEDKKESK